MPQTPSEEQFGERRRITLLEPDPALRAVVIRSLLRLGCVVSTKRSREQVIDALETGPIDGAIIALEADASLAAALHTANHLRAPIVVLTNFPAEPRMMESFSSILFLQKPFDMRELLAHLRLPQKAFIVRGGI
jgi:DNA-binding response OmpR family regulator